MTFERSGGQGKERIKHPGSILAIHYKLHGGDGVSLQSQLLHNTLRKSSIDVHECCADLPEGTAGLRLPKLSYQSKEIKDLRQRIFDPSSKASEEEILHQLDEISTIIRTSIERYIDEHHIQTLDVHNIFSLPFHPAATIALYELARSRPDVRLIAHHHDFVFENREVLLPPTKYPRVAERLQRAMLPNLPNITHVTINSRAAEYLLKEQNIHASVIPDGFDFDAFSHESRRGSSFREMAGIDPNDLVIGVMTRIVPRKAIEFAVQFVEALTKERHRLEDIPGGIGPKSRRFSTQNDIVLVLPQHEDVADNGHYFQSIKHYAASRGVNIVEGENIVESDIQKNKRSTGKVPFYDIYSELDVICYPTTQEGFGNQLLESLALAPNVVPVVFEYPVFQTDIAPYVPHIISLGRSFETNAERPDLKSLPQSVVENAVEQTIYYLKNKEESAVHGRENFLSAKQQFNMNTLAENVVRVLSTTQMA